MFKRVQKSVSKQAIGLTKRIKNSDDLQGDDDGVTFQYDHLDDESSSSEDESGQEDTTDGEEEEEEEEEDVEKSLSHSNKKRKRQETDDKDQDENEDESDNEDAESDESEEPEKVIITVQDALKDPIYIPADGPNKAGIPVNNCIACPSVRLKAEVAIQLHLNSKVHQRRWKKLQKYSEQNMDQEALEEIDARDAVDAMDVLDKKIQTELAEKRVQDKQAKLNEVKEKRLAKVNQKKAQWEKKRNSKRQQTRPIRLFQRTTIIHHPITQKKIQTSR